MNPYAIAINMGLNGSILGLSFFGEKPFLALHPAVDLTS
jgi:hypothetical protein